VAVYGPERETQGGSSGRIRRRPSCCSRSRRHTCPRASSKQIAFTLQGSALRPFIATQLRLTEVRANADRIDYLQSELDSLSAVVSTQAALADENRTLRELLGLAERAASGLRPQRRSCDQERPAPRACSSSTSAFDEGVREDAPVVSARGLVGVIRDVRGRSSVGMDWTTRTSARAPCSRTAPPSASSRTCAARSGSRTGSCSTAPPTTRTVSRGHARAHERARRVFPRGIPIGTVESSSPRRRVSGCKSYWLRPAVQPGSVTHVLVATVGGRDDLLDLSRRFPDGGLRRLGGVGRIGRPPGVRRAASGAVSGARAWRTWILVAALVIVHFLLHVGLGYGRGAPDLLTLGLLLAAREVRAGAAAAVGLLFGLLEDALSVLAFGANTVAMTAIGILGAFTRDSVRGRLAALRESRTSSRGSGCVTSSTGSWSGTSFASRSSIRFSSRGPSPARTLWW
jgi:hypothetical protein